MLSEIPKEESESLDNSDAELVSEPKIESINDSVSDQGSDKEK